MIPLDPGLDPPEPEDLLRAYTAVRGWGGNHAMSATEVWGPFDHWDDCGERWADARPSGDDFRGYDLWRSDVGPWPSSGDDPRPNNLSTERRKVMDLATHETTLRAAQQLLETGSFWLLDLWESLSPSRQRDVVKTLAEQPTFTVALKAVGFVRKNPLGLTDEDIDEVIAAVGGKA